MYQDGIEMVRNTGRIVSGSNIDSRWDRIDRMGRHQKHNDGINKE